MSSKSDRLSVLFLITFWSLSASALAVRAQSSVSPATVRTTPEANGIAQLRQEWARNLHDKKVDASVAAYDPDAEFLQPDGNCVRGTAALHKLFASITATYDSDLIFNSQRFEASGNLAYDSGTYRETLIVQATRKPQLSTGSYLTVYRRNRSGAWLIVEQAWMGSIQ
jgi:ketosteroid isomerase-like protein